MVASIDWIWVYLNTDDQNSLFPPISIALSDRHGAIWNARKLSSRVAACILHKVDDVVCLLLACSFWSNVPSVEGYSVLQ